ncbi:hypothetical protein MRX96_057291 [Rhipicephalus microplus]
MLQGQPGERPSVPSQDGVSDHVAAVLETVRRRTVVPPMRGHGGNPLTYHKRLPVTRSKGEPQAKPAGISGFLRRFRRHPSRAHRERQATPKYLGQTVLAGGQTPRQSPAQQRRHGTPARRRRHWIDLA